MSAGCVKRFRTLKTKELYLGASEACFAKLHTQGAAKGNTQHSWQAPLNALFFSQIRSQRTTTHRCFDSDGRSFRIHATSLTAGVFGVWTEEKMFPCKIGVKLRCQNTFNAGLHNSIRATDVASCCDC